MKLRLCFRWALFLIIFLKTGLLAHGAIYINVGETYTCDIGYISHFKECVWTTSDYHAIDFVGTVSRYSTSVTVQCLSKPTYATPVTIHCQYYYYDLDPATGRYTYLRSGYKDFQFFIRDNGPTDISVYPSSINLDVGSSYTLTANVTPSTADQTVAWSTSNYSVASVNSYGTVVANAPGTAWITATTVNGKTADCYVSVNAVQPSQITVSPSSTTLAIGETKQLSYSLIPASASTSVTWSSSATSVATVSSSGLVTAKKEGTAQITAKTSNGLSSTCVVSVYKPVPTTIQLSDKSLTLSVGSSKTLTYTVSPSNAIYSVTWSSDAVGVATVNSSGLVTAVASGTAKVTVRTDNGKTDQCTVTVPPLPQSITLPASLSLSLNTSQQLVCTVYPSNAVTTISWHSDDSSIATVSQNGAVTARGVGQTYITATTTNGLQANCLVIVSEPKYSLLVWTRDGGKMAYAFADHPQVLIAGDLFTVSSARVTME